MHAWTHELGRSEPMVIGGDTVTTVNPFDLIFRKSQDLRYLI